MFDTPLHHTVFRNGSSPYFPRKEDRIPPFYPLRSCHSFDFRDAQTPPQLPTHSIVPVVTGVAHGLSTYTRLDGHVASPGFSDAVADDATVDMIACQALVDDVADVKRREL